MMITTDEDVELAHHHLNMGTKHFEVVSGNCNLSAIQYEHYLPSVNYNTILFSLVT